MANGTKIQRPQDSSMQGVIACHAVERTQTIAKSNGHVQLKPSLLQKICNVVKCILTLSVATFFCWTNPVIFTAGLFTGMWKAEAADDLIKRITDVWKTRAFNHSSIGYFGSIVACVWAVFSAPQLCGIGSLIFAAGLGSTLFHKSQTIKNSCGNQFYFDSPHKAC